MTVGARIRAEREAQGLQRKDLAALAGIPYPTLAGIENADQGTSTRLHAIAAALRVSPRWLETGRGPKEVAPATGEPDWADIQGYAQAIGLGTGPEAQEYAETHKLKFRADSLRRQRLSPGRLAVMYGDGDSMQPRINPGDAIMFDTSDTDPRDGALYVILVPGAAAGEYQVKRAMVLDGAVYFQADNPTGDHNWLKPRRMDSKRDPIKVIGRVRWIGSWER